MVQRHAGLRTQFLRFDGSALYVVDRHVAGVDRQFSLFAHVVPHRRDCTITPLADKCADIVCSGHLVQRLRLHKFRRVVRIRETVRQPDEIFALFLQAFERLRRHLVRKP